jgi:hypothetical protein
LAAVASGTTIFTLRQPLLLTTTPPPLNYRLYPKAEQPPSAQRYSTRKRAPNYAYFFWEKIDVIRAEIEDYMTILNSNELQKSKIL